ncbi:DUF2442 domain-containing protein [Actinobacillus porcinus]|uniref:DUF2442 domain-containing protein n=1 Tax=Actinobacillus porcinus TaxID=51048 RepID=UPI002A911F21|nr:DUF2442 domain-containing protein [Actinobacillus porcinus]MDY6215134.1 DUF2442 domain-containing protein [Actinobacillus porcinus]
MTSSALAVATKVTINQDLFHITLQDGRILGVPFDWFPKLLNASQAERENYELSPTGEGIHWWDLDLNLSINRLLQGRREFNPDWSMKDYLTRKGLSSPSV